MKNIKQQLSELAIEAANQSRNLLSKRETKENGQLVVTIVSDTSELEKTIESAKNLINSLSTEDLQTVLMNYFIQDYLSLNPITIRAYLTADEAKKQFLNNH